MKLLLIGLPLGSACERYMKVQLFGPVGLMKYPVRMEMALTRSLRGGYFCNRIKGLQDNEEKTSFKMLDKLCGLDMLRCHNE